MATYTPTGAATLLITQSGILTARVEVALLQRAASRYAGAVSAEAVYIRALAANPVGQAVAALPIVLATASVAAPGTDTSPIALTDAELATTVTAIWTFLCGG